MSKIYTSIDQLIGKTPLLELRNFEKKHALGAKVLAKLEYFNPAGSVKDRIAKAMFTYRTIISESGVQFNENLLGYLALVFSLLLSVSADGSGYVKQSTQVNRGNRYPAYTLSPVPPPEHLHTDWQRSRRFHRETGLNPYIHGC